MLFNTFQFAIFFALLFALHRSLPERHRNGLLLFGSVLFYTLWIPSYLVLLLADLGVNYLLLRAMVRSHRPRVWLAASIVFTIGLLLYFKYAAFLVESLLPVFAWGFGWRPDIPEFFLPLGISFYSFQIIALAVDTQRRHIAPVESFSRYALFISFFPQLIAGPIVRGSEFLPQLERGGLVSSERNRRGLWLIACGLTKKVVFADFLLSPFVDEIFGAPPVARAPFHLIALYSFAFQIYFDFSGYTDMARGLALLLGYELPLNFREPYLSKNPAEFWQRWHITLSTWLRDYLFFGLGGGSRGAARAGINLFITMFLGGLWHGAAWTFAIWGAYHGLLLAAHRIAQPLLRRVRPGTAVTSWIWDALRVLVTFHLICLGLAFFRAASLEDAWTILHSVLTWSQSDGWPAMQTLIVVVCMLGHGLERVARIHLPKAQEFVANRGWGPLAEGSAFGIVMGIAIAVSGSGGEFIYFQF